MNDLYSGITNVGAGQNGSDLYVVHNDNEDNKYIKDSYSGITNVGAGQDMAGIRVFTTRQHKDLHHDQCVINCPVTVKVVVNKLSLHHSKCHLPCIWSSTSVYSYSLRAAQCFSVLVPFVLMMHEFCSASFLTLPNG